MPDLKKMLTLEALSEALPSWLKRSTKPEYNADEIDSTLTTNQFVTASDKDNWNAKGTYSKPSGGIPKSDLSSIVQTSLEKADSALQNETDPTVPTWAKQTNKPSYTQDEVADGSTYKRVTQTEKDTWSGKQNALTTTQMQAVNSGITSEKVTQITTNQTEIWLVNKYGGGKNYINSNDLDAIKALNTTGWTWNNNVAQKNSVSFTVNKDGTIKVNGTPSALTEFKLPIDHQTEIDGTSVLSTGILDTGDNPIVMRYSGGSYVVPDNYGYVNIPANTVATEIIIQVRITGTAPSNLLYKPMLCITEDWDASHDYQPYAKSNYELTQYTDGCSLDTVAKSSGSLDDITANAFAVYGGTVTGKPVDNDGNTSAFTGLCKTDIYNSSEAMQTLTRLSNGHRWVRTKSAGTWNPWVKLWGRVNKKIEFTAAAADTWELAYTITMPPKTIINVQASLAFNSSPVRGLLLTTSNTNPLSGNDLMTIDQQTSNDRFLMNVSATYVNANNVSKSLYMFAKNSLPNSTNRIALSYDIDSYAG